MNQTIEAIIDEVGRIHLLQPLRITGPHRALVTILDDFPVQNAKGTDANAIEDADELFGIWQDYSETSSVTDYVRSLRKGRFA